jgi:hypothetical protein
MSLRVFYSITYQGMHLKSGHCYHFGYSRYENDPHPIIFFLNAIVGTNPNTGHLWNLIQGINLNYVPKNSRLKFVQMWKPVVTMGANMLMTWRRIQGQMPFLRGRGGMIPIRRYLLGPGRYIVSPRWVPAESYQRVVLQGMTKDYFNIQWQKVRELTGQVVPGVQEEATLQQPQGTGLSPFREQPVSTKNTGVLQQLQEAAQAKKGNPMAGNVAKANVKSMIKGMLK